MEKRIWTKPQAVVENFEVTEYIAACGDVTTHYNFECNATGGILGVVFEDTNKSGMLDAGDKPLTSILGGYHACGYEHTASKEEEFVDGFYLTGADGNELVTPVNVYTENRTHVHCTLQTDMSQWEETKS